MAFILLQSVKIIRRIFPDKIYHYRYSNNENVYYDNTYTGKKEYSSGAEYLTMTCNEEDSQIPESTGLMVLYLGILYLKYGYKPIKM